MIPFSGNFKHFATIPQSISCEPRSQNEPPSDAKACLKRLSARCASQFVGDFVRGGAVAGYGNRIRAKYTAKWGVQIAGMIFQTGSSNIIINKGCVNQLRSLYSPMNQKYFCCLSHNPALRSSRYSWYAFSTICFSFAKRSRW